MKYVIANWKNNQDSRETVEYFKVFSSLFREKILQKYSVEKINETNVIFSPQDITMAVADYYLRENHLSSLFKLAAQNIAEKEHSSEMGSTSAYAVKEYVDYVIVGHSYRREQFGENDKQIGNKIATVLRNKMQPILCIGETYIERHEKHTETVLVNQLQSNLAMITEQELSQVIIAYEPIWAISSNSSPRHKHATVSEVAPAIKIIRKWLANNYSKKLATKIPVIYGGSVNSSNVGNYMKKSNSDGLLVGSASLDPVEFSKIVTKAIM